MHVRQGFFCALITELEGGTVLADQPLHHGVSP
jgi:hypothetical protein